MTNESITATKIAIGVATGVLVGGLLLRVCERTLDKRELEQVVKQLTPAPLTQQQIEDLQRPQYRARAEQLATDLRSQKAVDEARNAAAIEMAANTARELAWQRYYQRPKECDNPATDAALVECSNRSIQAREQFNRTYKP